MTSNESIPEGEQKSNDFEKLDVVTSDKREGFFWVFISGLCGFFLLVLSTTLPQGAPLSDLLNVTLIVLAVIFLPYIFRLIFGFYPIQFLKMRSRKYEQLKRDSLEPKSPAELFDSYVLSSGRLAESIYSRAKVFLFVGVIVALLGLVFFYTQTGKIVYLKRAGEDHRQAISELTTAIPPVNQAISSEEQQLAGIGPSLLITMAPTFGILFFIELIAFFFLRQYRSAMDEFRYYEAIKRNREETLALIVMLDKSEKPIDVMELLKMDSFFSKGGSILSAGGSTEIIETRKLEKNELDLLDKVVDVVSRSKK
jgi:hypothetical protein